MLIDLKIKIIFWVLLSWFPFCFVLLNNKPSILRCFQVALLPVAAANTSTFFKDTLNFVGCSRPFNKVLALL